MEETDWTFIKRLASHFGTSVITDCLSPAPRMVIGMSLSSKTLNFSQAQYTACRSDKSIRFGLHSVDATYYIVTTTENGNIGDCGYINHHRLFICEKKTSFERGEIIHTYTLADKAFLFTPKAFNDNISGLSLAGTVVKAQKESVYIQLDIDKDKSNADYPFDWAPLTGNIMYCMPKLGTSVSVHFPTNDESLARAVTSPRSSNTGSGFQNTANRGIITEHGKRLDLYPGRMGLQGAGGSFDMTDETGIMLSSQSAITMVANGKIHFEATNININIPLEIQMLQSGNYASAIASTVVPAGTGIAKIGGMVAPTMALTAMATESSVSLCNQFDFVGGNGTRFYGCVYVQYEPFDDAPQKGKFKIPWNIIGAVIGSIALVAVATLLVTSSMVMPLLASACITAVCAGVTNMIIQTFGEKKSLSDVDYDEVILSTCSGLVSGAFALTPIGLPGQVLINAAIGGTQSYLSGGSASDIAEAAFAAGISGAFGGAGFKPKLHFWNWLHYEEIIKTIVKGVLVGNVGTVGDKLINIIDPLLEYLESITPNNLEGENDHA